MFDKALARIGASLEAAGIPYMIIGGQAVLLYGEPRLTRDIDITLGVNIDRLETLLAVAQHLSLKLLPEDVAAFVRQTMVICMGGKGGFLYFVVATSHGGYFKKALRQRGPL